MAGPAKSKKPTVLEKRFKIGKKVGKGGMGVVFAGKDLVTGKPVAVKFLQPKHASDEKQVKRFLREAEMLNRLDHPRIVRIHSVGTHGKTHYIVMDFLEGQTLAAMIRAGHRFEMEEAVEIFRNLAHGLAYAHEEGIIHRDIKPSNIMVQSDGMCVLTDFGLARRAEASDITQTGAVLGTVQYMSPEQASGKDELDERSDIFSLGVVAYEMLTGVSPFEGGSLFNVLKKVVEEDPPPARRLKASIPNDLSTIVSICMSKRRKDRFQTMEELAEALDSYLDGEFAVELGEDDADDDLVEAVVTFGADQREGYGQGRGAKRRDSRGGRRPSSRRQAVVDVSKPPLAATLLTGVDAAHILILFIVMLAQLASNPTQAEKSGALGGLVFVVLYGALFLGLDAAMFLGDPKKMVPVRRAFLFLQFILTLCTLIGPVLILYFFISLRKYAEEVQRQERLDRRRRHAPR